MLISPDCDIGAASAFCGFHNAKETHKAKTETIFETQLNFFGPLNPLF